MAVELLFEGSTPLARRLLAEAPHDSEAAMIERAYELLGELTEEEKIATVNAHPRIGADRAHLSRLSLAEQGADRVPGLERLNADYESRFGFRFVVFVNGRPKSEIVEVLRQRLANGRNQELETGLRAVVDIAASRLGK
ncbi:MAG TPA: 2-oxo-4-hydroxy-4-carboxy-5-ureidoimidazoline decarboxylase [Candidatus Dormibacteraeota bacterium]